MHLAKWEYDSAKLQQVNTIIKFILFKLNLAAPKSKERGHVRITKRYSKKQSQKKESKKSKEREREHNKKSKIDGASNSSRICLYMIINIFF